MKHIWTWIVIILTSGAALAVSDEIPDAAGTEASSVLQAYFTACGGLENLGKVQSVSFNAAMPAYDYRYKVVIGENGRFLYSDANQTVGSDGETMWVNYQGMVGDVPENGRERYEDLTFNGFFLQGLLDDSRQAVTLDYAGTESQLDQTYHVLKSPPGSDPERTYYFNASTGLLDKTIATTPDPEGMNARIITRFMGYQPAGNVILFTALESSDLENGRMIQPRTEFSDLAINPELLPDRFLRPASEIDPATVKDGEIRGKIIDVSDYGSFITNVSQEVMEQETVRAPAYQVQIKDYTQTHRYIESLGEVQVDRGDRILLFNNTPALWVVKAYDGMSSDIDAREGDLIYLKPVTGSEEAPAETGAESPRTGNAANSAHGSAPPPSVTIPRAPSEPLPDADRIMRYKPFGNTGLKVSDVSVGGGSLADPMVVAYALDKGMNYFDTAESYGRGASEEAIGQVAKTRRKEMIICTKMAMNGETTLEDMLTRFDQCLARLQTDYADVLMIHGGNPDAVNNPQIHQGFAQLKSQGKLKFSGISCHGPNMTETLWPVVRERKADVILLSYDPVTYPDLPELLKAAEEQGIALVAMKVFTSARGADLPEYVQGKQPFNVAALRWVLSDPFIDTCIPSVTFLDHVDQYVRVSGYPGDGSDDGTAGMPAEQPDDAGGSAGSVITGASDVLKAIPDDLVLTGDTLSFAQEDLWKHINGADQQYIAFGCRSLTVAYFQEASGKDAMTVEVYEMPDASCSFGIYTRQKSRSGPFLDIGVEGYVSGNMLIFHKDRFYVQLAAPDETPASVTRLKNTARAMAAAIPGSSEPPAAFRMFPGDLFSPDTFAYIYDGILGIQGLGNGYAAVARVADTDVTFILIPEPGVESPGTPAVTVAGAWDKWGETPLTPVTVGGVSGVHGIMKYKGPVTILTQDGTRLIITGTEPGDALATAVTQIFK